MCTNTCILSRTYQTIVIFRYSFILRDEFLFFEESQLTVSFLNITECIWILNSHYIGLNLRFYFMTDFVGSITQSSQSLRFKKPSELLSGKYKTNDLALFSVLTCWLKSSRGTWQVCGPNNGAPLLFIAHIVLYLFNIPAFYRCQRPYIFLFCENPRS